jgi:hypothetical protein
MKQQGIDAIDPAILKKEKRKNTILANAINNKYQNDQLKKQMGSGEIELFPKPTKKEGLPEEVYSKLRA